MDEFAVPRPNRYGRGSDKEQEKQPGQSVCRLAGLFHALIIYNAQGKFPNGPPPECGQTNPRRPGWP